MPPVGNFKRLENYMLENIKLELIEYGKKLFDTKLTKGTGGNLSYYDRKSGYVCLTPSGISFHEIKVEDIVVTDIDANIIEGNRVPTSEWEMHLNLYRTRPEFNAVIHAHTMWSTVLACLRQGLPATNYMIAVAGKDVRVAEYATYGTHELAMNAAKAMEGRRAAILANHGVIAGAQDLKNAFNIIDELEYCAEIYCKARAIGNPVVLPDSEMELMLEKFKHYGQK